MSLHRARDAHAVAVDFKIMSAHIDCHSSLHGARDAQLQLISNYVAYVAPWELCPGDFLNSKYNIACWAGLGPIQQKALLLGNIWLFFGRYWRQTLCEWMPKERAKKGQEWRIELPLMNQNRAKYDYGTVEFEKNTGEVRHYKIKVRKNRKSEHRAIYEKTQTSQYTYDLCVQCTWIYPILGGLGNGKIFWASENFLLSQRGSLGPFLYRIFG